MDEKNARVLIDRKRKHALSDETALVLLELSARGPLTQRDLERDLAINFHAVRRITGALVHSGHLKSMPGEENPRVPAFALADHGKRLVKTLLLVPAR